MAHQPGSATPFMSPQGGQGTQSDGGGGTAMYAKEELDAYTTNYDSSTMALSIDEFRAQRQRRREETTLHGSDDSRRRAELPSGRPSLLVDLDSRINVIGGHALKREFRPVIEKCHPEITTSRRSRRLNVHGVGAGSAPLR